MVLKLFRIWVQIILFSSLAYSCRESKFVQGSATSSVICKYVNVDSSIILGDIKNLTSCLLNLLETNVKSQRSAYVYFQINRQSLISNSVIVNIESINQEASTLFFLCDGNNLKKRKKQKIDFYKVRDLNKVTAKMDVFFHSYCYISDGVIEGLLYYSEGKLKNGIYSTGSLRFLEENKELIGSEFYELIKLFRKTT